MSEKILRFISKFWVLFPLSLFILVRLVEFQGLYGMDSFAYYFYAEDLQAYWEGGQAPGPFFWPKLFPILIAVVGQVMPLNLAGQVVSLSALIGTGCFVGKMIKLLFKESDFVNFYALIAIVFSPYLFRSGLQIMSESMACFGFSACLYFGFLYIKHDKLKDLGLALLFALIAVFTRYAAIIPLIPFGLCLIWETWTKKNKLALMVIGVGMILTLLFSFICLDIESILSHHFLEEWSVNNFFKRNFPSDTKHQLASLGFSYPNIVYYPLIVFHPGFFILGIPLLFFAFVKKQQLGKIAKKTLIPIFLFNTLFLMGTSFQGDRYQFFSFIVLVVLLFPSFSFLVKLSSNLFSNLLILFLLFQIGLCGLAIWPSVQRSQLEKIIAEKVIQQKQTKLYTFEMDLSMKYFTEKEVEGLWQEGPIELKQEALLLFNPAKFEQRFKGKWINNNWNQIRGDYELVEIETFSQGWKLYRIE